MVQEQVQHQLGMTLTAIVPTLIEGLQAWIAGGQQGPPLVPSFTANNSHNVQAAPLVSSAAAVLVSTAAAPLVSPAEANQGRPLLATHNPRPQPLNQGRQNGGDRCSQLLSHLLFDYLRNSPHLCLEFLNLALLAFRAGLFLLSPTSVIV